MPGYIPRQLLDQYPADNSEPTYRMSMLPFGTYADPNGGGEHLGLAMPGMVTEPINALMRLAQNSRFEDGHLGIPNPENLDNQNDVLTGLLSMYGGNATRGLGAGKAAVEAAIPAAQRAATTGFDLWHGSPHDFRQFDISKIGSGEGNQAYGRGLYFAESPDTAKFYQRSLGTNMADPAIDDYARAAFTAAKGGSPADAVAYARRMADERSWAPNDAAGWENAANLIESGSQKRPQDGYLYQTHVNANPDDFLDWEALTDAQRNALRTHGSAPNLEAPGWSYLDRGSRGTTGGTRNYVVTDPSVLSIAHKWHGDTQLFSDTGKPSIFGAAVAASPNEPHDDWSNWLLSHR